MKNQVKRLFNLIVICIFALCANAQESAEVVRFNNKTHQKETLCTVHYKTVGNVFYVDTPFSYLGIVFSDNKTNKYAYEKSLVLKKDKNTNWYSVKLDNSQFGNTTGRHISAIIVRNCKSDKVKDRQCYDAYLYNNTVVIASWKGSPELNKDTRNIIKHLEK